MVVLLFGVFKTTCCIYNTFIMSNIFTENDRYSPTEIFINNQDYIKRFSSFNQFPIERSDNPSPIPIRRGLLATYSNSITVDAPNKIMLTIPDNTK